MEIGRWLPLNEEREKWELWTEAYVYSLQHVAEAATGGSWKSEGEGMVPQINPFVHAFLLATRWHVSPCAIHECWLPEQIIVPKEPMDEICAIVTQCLGKTTMQKLSYTAWDMFTYPASDKSNWKKDCLTPLE